MLSAKAILSYQQLLKQKGIKHKTDVSVEAEQALKNFSLLIGLIQKELSKRKDVTM